MMEHINREHIDLERPFQFATQVEITRSEFEFEKLNEVDWGTPKKRAVEKPKVEFFERKSRGSLF